jgi:Domain of unknown function (DUF4169)
MSNILSLSKARKAKARAGKEAEAEQILFGRTKAEKQLAKAENELARKRMDAHRLAPEKPDA